jgi:TrmH family RNA methyltransferase
VTRTILSANAEYQVLASLRTNRQKRNRENAFVVEGVRNVNAAIAHEWTVRNVLVPRGAARSPWAEEVATDRDVVELAPALFDDLTDREERPELLLVCEKRSGSLADIVVNQGCVVVVLDRPSSPGNVGTIIRSSDAFGAAAVVLAGHGVDPYEPRVVRATTGSFFAVPVIEIAAADALIAWAREHAVTMVATDESGDSGLDALPAPPAAYLFGNETTGLSRALRDAADVNVAIGMTGSASSLNVAAAHAIVLHAAFSRERH